MQRNRFFYLIGVLTCIVMVSLSSEASAKLKIVTTIPDLASIAQEIGGEKVEVQSIAKGSQDPHYVEAKPSYTLMVNKADLLIVVGLQLEVGWLPLLIQNSRNPKIVPGSAGYLSAAEKIEVLEHPTEKVTRAQGDIHPEGNPHYWLDPRNAILIAQLVTERLKTLSPKDASYFQKRLDDFLTALRTKISEWEKRLSSIRKLEVVAYHKQWEYLANWIGLQIVGYIEDRPGIPPTPKHLSSLMDLMRQRKVHLILSANFTDPKLPKNVAGKTGTALVILPASTGGEKEIKSYIQLFDVIVARLESAASAAKGGEKI